MDLFLTSPYCVPVSAIAMTVLVVGVVIWGKTRQKELQIDHDLQIQRMEHERRMKELEIEKLRLETGRAS